jgi:ribosomal protein RSM22 (predicted rRNA methylase)
MASFLVDRSTGDEFLVLAVAADRGEAAESKSRICEDPARRKGARCASEFDVRTGVGGDSVVGELSE